MPRPTSQPPATAKPMVPVRARMTRSVIGRRAALRLAAAPLAAVTLGALLPACVPALTGGPPTALRILVPQFRDAPVDTTVERFTTLAQQVNDSKSGFTIELVKLPTDTGSYADDIAREVNGALPVKPIDLIVAPHGTVPALVGKQAVLSLERFAKNDRDLKQDDYFPAVLEANRYRGQLYALPYICSPQVVYYNPKLFADAGLKPPTNTWTWSEFTQAARAMTHPTGAGGGTYGLMLAPGVPSVQTFIWQNGGEVIDKDGRVVIDQPAAVQAIKFMGDLTTREHVAPAMSELSGNVIQDLIAANRVGMVMFHVSLGFFWRGEAGFELQLAEMPQGRARATVLTSSALAIGARTQNPDATYLALRSLASAAEKTAIAPPQRSLARDLRKNEPRLSDQDVSTIINSLEYARGPVYENHAAVMLALRDLIEGPVLAGQAPAEDAAHAAAVAIDVAIHRTTG